MLLRVELLIGKSSSIPQSNQAFQRVIIHELVLRSIADRFVGMQDWIRKLERAKALLDEGALTLEEFETEKARLLASSASTYALKEDQSANRHVNENRGVGNTARVKAVAMVVASISVAIVAYFLLAEQSSKPSTVPTVAEPRQSAAVVPAAIPTHASLPVTNRPASQPTPYPTPEVAKKADEPAAWTITEQALIERWSELNELCRGGSGDDPSTMEACDLREEVFAQLASADICLGKSGQYGYQMEMHRCNERSLSRQ